ncbi:MAG: hypothetical protein ACE14M_10590 [Terriglobales bacterium]
MLFTAPIRHLILIFFITLAVIPLQSQQLGPKEIIERSVEANEKDWDAAPEYDYFDREQDGEKSKTYKVMMLYGSRYSRLVAINDKPLSPEDEAKEQQRFETAVAQRQRETPDERRKRIAAYQKERERDHVLMGELTKALNFTLVGKEMLGAHEVYVLKGTPRRGYNPPNNQAKALTGMQGTLFVETNTFHWVKAEGEVVRPIWIEGFFARIQPGTRFLLEQMPVGDGVWMPSRFSMHAKAKVFFLFSHTEWEDDTYFGYHKPKPLTASDVAPSKPGANPPGQAEHAPGQNDSADPAESGQQ